MRFKDQQLEKLQEEDGLINQLQIKVNATSENLNEVVSDLTMAESEKEMEIS